VPNAGSTVDAHDLLCGLCLTICVEVEQSEGTPYSSFGIQGKGQRMRVMTLIAHSREGVLAPPWPFDTLSVCRIRWS